MGSIVDQNLLVKVDTEENLQAGLKKAVNIILSGGVVAFPTESFYGLAVNATDEGAIQRLFAIKERKSESPVLILIGSVQALDQYVRHISKVAQELITRFWPGGLTLIFDAKPNISSLLTAGTGKIGIRLSSHPVATQLARSAGVPITGTSANISGQPPCVSATEIFHSLGKMVDVILDGGKTEGGKGSTVLDTTVTPPRILREGMVGHEQLKPFITI